MIEVATMLFATTGYEATSLRQIAAASEIDIATLKYHFEDKPTLFGEVYRRGHHGFLQVLDPFLDRLDDVEDRETMAELIDDLVVAMHDFVESHLPFVRLTLYRMLEETADVILIEEELQAIAISRISEKFARLTSRGVTSDIDARAFVVFLVTSFSTWHVTGRVKPSWLGSPKIQTEAGRARSESFFVSMLENLLLSGTP